jgi:hypothetical protein
MANRTPDGVYADWNRFLKDGKGAYSVGVYRRSAVSTDGDSAPHIYECGQASFKRVIRWMLASEQAGNGRCFLEDDGWCYESAGSRSLLGYDAVLDMSAYDGFLDKTDRSFL